MITALLGGVLAGYAIAIPVGAIAVLLLDTGMRRGFRPAAAGAAGAASADGIYATLAAFFGAALAVIIEPLIQPLRLVAVFVLVAIGVLGIRSALAGQATGRSERLPSGLLATYLRLLGLTLLNPATIVYFAALIVGLPLIGAEPANRAAFALGAFLASLSWQMLLAALGALAHRRLPPHVQLAASLIGNLVILGFAAIVGYGLVSG